MKLEVLEYLPEMNSKAIPLLFIHGANHGAWCWKENFLPYFSSKGFPSYALSLRGHSGSEGREKLHSFSLKDYMDDVLETMLILKNKPVLIGHSMGGAIVQKILLLHPDKIKAAVLMAPVPPNGMLKDEFRLKLTKFIIQIFKWENVNFYEYMFFSKELPVKKRKMYLRLLQPESNKARNDLVKVIITKPISTIVPLLVLGSRRDNIFSKRTIFYIGKTYKTKPAMFSNICHDMMLDPNWKIVADHILTFLYRTISKS